jgi:hypothetical protein
LMREGGTAVVVHINNVRLQGKKCIKCRVVLGGRLKLNARAPTYVPTAVSGTRSQQQWGLEWAPRAGQCGHQQHKQRKQRPQRRSVPPAPGFATHSDYNHRYVDALKRGRE